MKQTQSGKEKTDGQGKARPRSRLARALRSIRSEAARALQNEVVPRRISEPGPGDPPLPPPLERGLSPEERAELCEVEDNEGRLLLCMKEQSALGQGLPLRLAACAPFTARGLRLVLHKKRGERPMQPGKWNIHAGPVRPGESGQEAALRLLAAECGISDAPLRLLAEIPGVASMKYIDSNTTPDQGPARRPSRRSEPETTLSGEAIFRKIHIDQFCGDHTRDAKLSGPLRLYAVDLPAGLYPLMPDADLLEVDADELEALARRAPELLGPELLLAALGRLLFR